MSQRPNDEIRPIVAGTLRWRKPLTGSFDSSTAATPDAMHSDRAVQTSSGFYPMSALSPADESSKLQLIEAVRGIENKSTGWFTKVLIAVGSLVFFVAIGAAVWSPKLVGMLAVVLLVHEAGHYIAMRIFGYRNVKMFFIPMLGAAVSGQHFNIAAWKKAIVYLAGPVPGIFLSLPMLFFGMQTETEWLIELGGLALVLNLLNLLPLLPLDGGWIMHLTVFSRSPLLELAARAVAIVVMVLGGIFLRDRILIFIAIPLLISLPTTFRVAKLVRRLRETPIPSPQQDQIPDMAIRQIADGMHSSSLAAIPIPQKAPLVVQIYESLVVRPPGVLTTMIIWFLYGSSFVVGVTGGVGVMLSGQMMRGELFPEELLDSVEHNVAIDPANAKFHLGTEPMQSSHLVIVPIDDPELFTTQLDQIPVQQLDQHTHARFGDVWITSVPSKPSIESIANDQQESSDEEMFDQMQEAMRPVDVRDTWLAPLAQFRPERQLFIISGAFNESLTIHCTAPDADTAHSVTKEHFQSAIFGDQLLIPTWSPIDAPTADQIECRRVLQLLNNGITEDSSPKLHRRVTMLSEQFFSKSQEARDNARFDDQAFVRFERETHELQKQYSTNVVDSLMGNPKLVGQAYLAYQEALGKRLGDLEASEEDYPLLETYLESVYELLGRSDPTKRHHHFASYTSGYVMTTEDALPKIQLHIHRANDQAATVAAIIAFLSKRGFTEFQLKFTTASEPQP